MIDYQNVLTQMSEAIDSFESSESGYVKQEYIENDVEDGLEHVKDTAKKYTDEANSIIDSVSDIVSITPIDESKLVDEVQKGKKNAEEIVEELYALDAEQVKALASVKEDLNDMRNFISDLETLFEDGDLSVSNYDVTAVLGLESFHSVSEGVYGEGGRIGLILNRLNNGEYLTYVERNHLYDYFQSILSDEKRKEISEIASMINEKNIDQLKDRLNEKVIISKDLIEEEMAMIQAYMYRGNNKIGDLEIKRETLTKLEAYLVLLKNYHSAMGNETIAKVDILQYKDSPNRVSEYYFESYLEMAEYDSNIRRFYSEEDFRSFAFDPDSYVKNPVNHTELTYYTKANASGMYKHLQNEGLVEELANYTPNFILNQVLNKIIESAGKGAGETISMAKAVVDYKSGKDELKKEIEIGKAHEIADNLSMEFAISKNGTYPGMDETVEVNLHPTTTTLEILERWEEVYEINPEIPYPREETALLDWYEINEYWIKHSNRIKPGLSDYIAGGTLEDGQSVEDVAKNKY